METPGMGDVGDALQAGNRECGQRTTHNTAVDATSLKAGVKEK